MTARASRSRSISRARLIGRQSFAVRHRRRHLPPRHRARPHLRLHERCRAAVGRRLRARLLAGELRRHRRRQPRHQHGRPALSRTSSSATRRSTRWATWRWPARRFIGCFRSYRGGHRLNAAALRRLLSDRSAFEIVETHAPRARPLGRDDRRQRAGLRALDALIRPIGFDRPVSAHGRDARAMPCMRHKNAPLPADSVAVARQLWSTAACRRSN